LSVVKIVFILVVGMIPVVNYERMERLKPAPLTTVPLNMNTISIGVIILGVIFLYKRNLEVTRRRERSRR